MTLSAFSGDAPCHPVSSCMEPVTRKIWSPPKDARGVIVFSSGSTAKGLYCSGRQSGLGLGATSSGEGVRRTTFSFSLATAASARRITGCRPVGQEKALW